jgi:hypothetical protein
MKFLILIFWTLLFKYSYGQRFYECTVECPSYAYMCKADVKDDSSSLNIRKDIKLYIDNIYIDSVGVDYITFDSVFKVKSNIDEHLDILQVGFMVNLGYDKEGDISELNYLVSGSSLIVDRSSLNGIANNAELLYLTLSRVFVYDSKYDLYYLLTIKENNRVLIKE